MKKDTLKVVFTDNCPSEYILSALKTRYEVDIDEKNPDIVFYGNFGLSHLRYHCIKVFINIECVAPDFNECDYAVSSSKIDFDGRNLYLPPALLLHLKDDRTIEEPLSPTMLHRRFCSFIYSNSKHGMGSRYRTAFCEKLMGYKKVDCPGNVLHNMDAPELSSRFTSGWMNSKIGFLGKYKFNIAFENCNRRGYITEKLSDSFLANTVPIYWGSEGDLGCFPKEAMIYANDYPDMESLIARVKEVDENDDEYMRLLAANPLRNGMTLSRWKEFCAFILRVADVAHCPEKCDQVDFSDVAVLRMVSANKFVISIMLCCALLRYVLQSFLIRRLRGEAFDDMIVASTRTRRVCSLLMATLFPGRY